MNSSRRTSMSYTVCLMFCLCHCPKSLDKSVVFIEHFPHVNRARANPYRSGFGLYSTGTKRLISVRDTPVKLIHTGVFAYSSLIRTTAGPLGPGRSCAVSSIGYEYMRTNASITHQLGRGIQLQSFKGHLSFSTAPRPQPQADLPQTNIVDDSTGGCSSPSKRKAQGGPSTFNKDKGDQNLLKLADDFGEL